jgi:hypothetical protein
MSFPIAYGRIGAVSKKLTILMRKTPLARIEAEKRRKFLHALDQIAM